MQKIKKILFTSPLLSLAAICFIIAALIFLTSQSTTQSEVKGVTKTEKPTATATITPQTEKPTESIAVSQNNLIILTPTITLVPTTPANTPTATVAPTSQPNATFQVDLSINGSSVGSVTLEQGANQCDILTKAKEQGKISQLLMKYDANLETNGVYQINGTGKENAIWWVYKVNRQSPNQGCSYIKANSGDIVEWEYKG